MSQPIVFISCGQFTTEEKQLGAHIVKMVESITGFKAFFAEKVQDLHGLDTNILDALQNCVGFITVLHPRGDINRPDGPPLTRASVWIEQEIAIATYIQRTEKRRLPIIAFKHNSIGLEGIRTLIQLNPIGFESDSEILAALPEQLLGWKTVQPTGIRLDMKSVVLTPQDGHPIRRFELHVVNDSNNRISEYNGELSVASGLLGHWGAIYPAEIHKKDPSRRYFQFNEKERGQVNPHQDIILMLLEYCTSCALQDLNIAAFVPEARFEAKIWINGREYSSMKTVKQLAFER